MQDPNSSFSQSDLTMMNKPPEFFCRDQQLGHEQQQHLNCPRCQSPNTKFCYYNNYNLSQPRHYCRNCKRYWTKGGTLRNIPVGGTSRKDKSSKKPRRRPSSSNATSTTDSTKTNEPKSSDPDSTNQLQQQDGYGFNLSFGSVLGTNGEFDNFNFVVDGGLGTSENGVPMSESSLIGNGGEDFRGESERFIGNGCGWPDLSIYTHHPGSSLE